LAKLAASKGANVLMLNRPSKRAEEALAAVNEVKADGAVVTHVDLDLSTFKSTAEGAAKVLEICYESGLDALVNNAGIMGFNDVASEDGYDIQMQVNHLSHFLLTKELLPLLEKVAEEKGEARIVNHSSMARLGDRIDVKYYQKNGGNLGGDDYDMAKFSGPRFDRYKQTKKANCLFTAALRDKLKAKGSKVKALVAHPGVSWTSLAGNMSNTGVEMPAMMVWVYKNFIVQSAEDGTLGIGRCTFDKSAENGDFFGPPGGRKAQRGEAVKLELEEMCQNVEDYTTLWTASEEAIGSKWDL
jgi:NAD(P)-dependent dehydrogenase (short-subunit alcohol dehydrogenase family)